MLRTWNVFLCFAVIALLLGGSMPASAEMYSVDVTCKELIHLPPSIVGRIGHWLPGWWGGYANDPHVNAMRTQLLANELAKQCQRNANTYILDAIQSVKSMPPVPDNALTLTCKQFSGSDAAWQDIVYNWLQGYMAYKNDSSFIDDDYMTNFDTFRYLCSANQGITLKEAAHRVWGSKK